MVTKSIPIIEFSCKWRCHDDFVWLTFTPYIPSVYVLSIKFRKLWLKGRCVSSRTYKKLHLLKMLSSQSYIKADISVNCCAPPRAQNLSKWKLYSACFYISTTDIQEPVWKMDTWRLLHCTSRTVHRLKFRSVGAIWSKGGTLIIAIVKRELSTNCIDLHFIHI